MSSSDRLTGPALWRLGETVRFGWREFHAVNPPSVVVGSILPRMLLQILFFTLLGGVLAGTRHQEYAFVGGLVLGLAMTVILYVSQVPVADKESGTFWRLRTGHLTPMVVFTARALPYPVVGFAVLLVSAAVVAPLAGLGGLAVRLLPVAGIYLLVAFTAMAAGLAAAAFAVGRRAETLVSNLMGYVVLLCSGAFLPPGRIPALDAIGTVVPGRHGLAAIHAHLRGDPWVSGVVAEAVVGVAWLGAATLVVAVQIRRARRHGHDDFA
ncbi:ABC transporter permease [Micromonospora echinofusca]|uniref:ABC transporter permease n=1 Tax=Micromonospora echinofusca TaxID=47858 RepID=A0ABS3VLH3_MICEH|nr:ABC transporter permease [Micromonospora echinofusca]MBO4205388.1 ABC transporter permease [Micromonospora echinofusca]